MKYFKETPCVIVDLVIRKENEESAIDAGVITLWSEMFDTPHPEEVLEIFRKNIKKLEFDKVEHAYLSQHSYRLADFPFLNVPEKSMLSTFDKSQPIPYIKIMVRPASFLRDNDRLC